MSAGFLDHIFAKPYTISMKNIFKYLLLFLSTALILGAVIYSKNTSFNDVEETYLSGIRKQYGPITPFEKTFVEYGHRFCSGDPVSSAEPGLLLFVNSSALLILCPERLNNFNIF